MAAQREKESTTPKGRPVNQFQRFVYGTLQALIVLGVGGSIHTGFVAFGNARVIKSITVSIKSLSNADKVMESRQNETTKLMYQIARINGEQTTELKYLHQSIKECREDVEKLDGK
ncbi:MAG: hypothetical protein DBP02_02140 [gamma proteobacterium symbiont of Ctena orbiculata]|nr:MAG: hypothetical protein DBP02_02140 [gamma proteobacterium symbiont of Ctena orbiculata]